jgi:hypothetical protein
MIMEKQRKKRILIIIALLLVIIATTVAFATLSSSLSINGEATLSTSWQVRFKSSTLSETVSGQAQVVSAPTLSDTNIGDFEIVLKAPGDSVVYTFDVENTGSVDAKIGTFTKSAIPTFTGLATEPSEKSADETLASNYITYTLTYTSGGAAVAEGDLLAAGETKNMTLTLSYSSSADVLPSDDVSITDLAIGMLYVQDV